MTAPIFQPASAQSIALFQKFLKGVGDSPSLIPSLLQKTIDFIDRERPDLTYEREIIVKALQSPDDLTHRQKALNIHQRFGRLFYALAPQVDQFKESLGMSDLPMDGNSDLSDDLCAQLAWSRLDALGSGAGTLWDMGRFYDPVGAMSGGIIYFLDRQSLESEWKMRSNDGIWSPPPAFGILSNESDDRLEKYNRGWNDKVGAVDLGFARELQMTVVPKVYGEYLRSKLGFHLAMPASEIAEEYLSKQWNQQLHTDVRILTSIKGLISNGETPLDYLEENRGRYATDLLGYVPSGREIDEIRKVKEGEQKSKRAPLQIVLASADGNKAIELALRLVGNGAQTGWYHHEGTLLQYVENLRLDLPVRFIILTDRELIRANEKASIDKNLQALRLGGDLFEEMLPYAFRGEIFGEKLREHFVEFYDKQMKQSEEDIRSVLALERIPANKRFLLPEVVNDLYGSWRTDRFGELYDLVYRIFRSDASQEDWEEAIVLLKIKIEEYYSVRNPRYGFCMAADKAAMMHDRTVTRDKLEVIAARLQSKGQISDDQYASLVALAKKEKEGFFFSMIPEGLVPEGLQIAAQLPARCRLKKIRMKDLPLSYSKAFLLVQRLQRSVFFDPDIYRKVIDISKDFGFVFENDASSEKNGYIRRLRELQGNFETAYNVLRASQHVLRGSRGTRALLARLSASTKRLIEGLERSSAIGQREIAYLNQGIVEMLTISNLFYILPPEQSKEQLEHWRRRLRKLSQFVENPHIEVLFGPSRNFEDQSALEMLQPLLKKRDLVFKLVGKGLIEQTYQMNVRLHAVDRAITKRDVEKALKNISRALEDQGAHLAVVDPPLYFFLSGLKGTVLEILKNLPKKLDQDQTLRIYQALIETLIHARRILVLPEEYAIGEIPYSVNRFLKILKYVRGDKDTDSPLWYFGRRPPMMFQIS